MPAVAVLTVLAHALLGFAQFRLAYGDHPLRSTAIYYIAVAILIVTYTAVIRCARSPSPSARRLLIAVPLLVQIGWLIPAPTLAIDAYSYTVDAATAHAGRNPYQHAVREAAHTVVGLEMSAYRWRPVHGISPYGPVWMNIVRAIGPLTDRPALSVLAFKLVSFLSIVAAGLLLYAVMPAPWGLVALAAFWWNPTVIVETAGEGHNDAVMIVAVLLALWALHRRWPVVATAALVVAVLTKYIPVLFALPCLVYAWRARLITPRALALSAVAALVIAAAAFAPFWAGDETFEGVRQAGYPHFIASTSGALLKVLPDSLLATRLLRLALALATVLVVVRVSFTMTGRIDDLMRACAAIALTYVLVSSPLFWAWYVLLPIVLLIGARNLMLVCVLMACSRLVAPFDLLRLHGILTWGAQAWLTTVIGLWVPLAFAVWQHSRVPSAFTGAAHHLGLAFRRRGVPA
jgi:hypothetical protein